MTMTMRTREQAESFSARTSDILVPYITLNGKQFLSILFPK